MKYEYSVPAHIKCTGTLQFYQYIIDRVLFTVYRGALAFSAIRNTAAAVLGGRCLFPVRSVVFGADFKEALRMCTHGADARCRKSNHYMTAITAFPDLDITLFEHFHSFHIP